MRNVNETLKKDVTSDNFSSHKNVCFALDLEDTFLENPQEEDGGEGWEVKLTSASLFRINQYCQYLNLPTFNQLSLSNQLVSLMFKLNLYVDCIG